MKKQNLFATPNCSTSNRNRFKSTFMGKRCLLFLFFILGLPLFIKGQPIYNGQQIPIAKAPYQVSLQRLYSTGWLHSGGGTIISDRWILTAAHCVTNGSTIFPDLRVHAGSDDQTSSAGQIVNIKNIFYHQYYNLPDNQIENDIALIELDPPYLSFNDDVMPVDYANLCNTSTADVSFPQSAYLSGWGRACSTCNFAQYLQAVTMPLIDNITAKQINQTPPPTGAGHPNNSRPIPSPGMIAFSKPSFGIFPGSGAAQGDSGGPAVIDKNGNKINVGVCSWGYSPKDELPSIYTSVRAYATWIEFITGFSISKPNVADLYSKDRPWDMGTEPSNANIFWESEDIWYEIN